MANIKEAFEEVTIYVVHSDADENNILQEFENLQEALEYAKDNIDELTYIEEVVKNPESDEIYSTEILWSYDEDDAEDQVVCEWCHELDYETNCRRELNLGMLCKNCQAALYSRGEKPVFEEAYDSDYAEGDDIFEQEFPEANTESKYSLEESSEPKWNLGSNKLVDRDSIEYQYLEELAARLQEEHPYNEDGDYIFYEVARTYEDYGAGMEWYTIIVNDPKSFAGSYQLLYPNQWIRLANTGDVEGVLEDILKGSQLTELFDVSVNAALDGGDNNKVSVLSSYEPEKGEDKLDELFDADINLSVDGGTGNDVSVLSPLGGLGEALQEGLNNSEFAEYLQLCKEIGIKGNKDLESFMNEVGLEAGCDPHNVLDALREYRAELGPDFKIIHEEAEQLEEGYKIDLPQIRVRDIQRELDLHGDTSFDLTEPVEESDEDGWRGASEIRIVEKEAGKYEGYYQWLDQDGDLIESDADEYFDDFEDLLYWLDDYLVNIVDLEEYIGSEIMEGLKDTRQPEEETESEEETELRTQDIAAEPEDQAAEAEQEQVIEVDSKVLEESQSQEISNEYRRLSKEYGVDFEELVYGEKGFMKTKYPEGFPDFDGDVIYSEKYWAELEEWIKENNKLNEDLKDTIKRPEAPKDLSVVKESGDKTISEGDLVWLNTHKGEDIVVQIIQFTKDSEGKLTGCKFVYTEPKVTRPHKDYWWKEDNK